MCVSTWLLNRFYLNMAESLEIERIVSGLRERRARVEASLSALAANVAASRESLVLFRTREQAGLAAAAPPTCDAGIAALDLEFSELQLELEHTESRKRVALEAELVAVDVELERALTGPSGSDDAHSWASLAHRNVDAIPLWPVEPYDVHAIAGDDGKFPLLQCRIVAPLAARGSDFRVDGTLPKLAFPGKLLRLRLTLTGTVATQCTKAVALSLAAALRTTYIDACCITVRDSSETLDVEAKHLRVCTVPAALQVDLCVPADAAVGSSISLRILVAGQVVSGFGPGGEHTVQVVRPALSPPLNFKDNTTNFWQTPCVAHSTGELFVPVINLKTVAVYDIKDATLTVPVNLLDCVGDQGSPSMGVCSAAASDEAGLLFLANRASDGFCMAVDLGTRAVRWRTRLAANFCCAGLALISKDVLVVSDVTNGTLSALGTSDGNLIDSMHELHEPSFLAFDDGASEILVSCKIKGHNSCIVVAVSWDATTRTLARKARDLPSIAEGKYSRPLAVMCLPDGASEGARRVLVVATFFTADLRVYSLPDLSPLHAETMHLEGEEACIVGLAADPGQGALLVSNRVTKSVHAVEWPLAAWEWRGE